MYDLKTILLAKRIRRKLDVTRLSVADIALLEIIKNASDNNPVRNATIENGIAYFDRVTASQPLVSLKLNIPVTQTGSGTPSPDNVRPLVGVSQAVIGQTSGYGEYFRGLLNGTYGFVDLGSLSYEPHTTGGATNTFRTPIPDKANGISNLICVGYSNYSGSVPDMPNMSVRGQASANILYVKNTSCSTGSEMATALNGVYLIYELAEPSTPVTPQEFAMLCQAFGITGNIYTFTFGQDICQGSIDWKRGVVVGTWSGKVDMGLLNWGYNSSFQAFYISLPNMYIPTTGQERLQGIANEVYPISTVDAISLMDDKSCLRYNGYLWTKDSDYTDRDDFKNSLIGKYVAYELAEPIEIDLTPTVINTLIGENVIFADMADVTECKYTRK